MSASQDDLEAALNELANLHQPGLLVCVGDPISADTQDGFLRGHGTQASSEGLRASQCGTVQKVNKLISVQPLHQRYVAELGDVVVGRVSEISQKRWKLDLQSRQEASLMLSAVNLPGGVQRRRTVEDELNMRTVYEEGDLLSAEVQALHADGSVALHTRSLKYGKLQCGTLITVPSSLVPRQRQHFALLDSIGVSMILGANGLIWIGQAPEASKEEKDYEKHDKVARIANCIRAIAKLSFLVTPTRVLEAYNESKSKNVSTYNVLSKEFSIAIVQKQIQQRLGSEE